MNWSGTLRSLHRLNGRIGLSFAVLAFCFNCATWPCKKTKTVVFVPNFQCSVTLLTKLRNKSIDATKVAYQLHAKDDNEINKLRMQYFAARDEASTVISLINGVILSGNEANLSRAASAYAKAVYSLTTFAKLTFYENDECIKLEENTSDSKKAMHALANVSIPVADIVEGLIVGITKSVLLVQEAKQTAEAKRRKEVADFLESFQLPEWNEILKKING